MSEYEKLDSKWIDEHSETFKEIEESMVPLDKQYIDKVKVQNLLVPEQELPVIPKFVADYLDFAKSDVPLMRVMELANTRNELPKWKKEYDWISANDEKFARAWLDGYTVEEEQKYYAKIKGHELTDHTRQYWYFFKVDESLNIGMKPNHPLHIGKLNKIEWANLGINDGNADFELVEELEE